MVQIHWLLILLIASLSGVAGFMLCAILTMGKMADQTMNELHQKWDDDAANEIQKKFVK